VHRVENSITGGAEGTAEAKTAGGPVGIVSLVT